MHIHPPGEAVELAEHIKFREDRPYTHKLYQTARSIVELVCLRPGQSLRAFEHRKREAFVHVLQGSFRFTPGEGDAELHAGQVRFFEGDQPVAPRNMGQEPGVFLVTLVKSG